MLSSKTKLLIYVDTPVESVGVLYDENTACFIFFFIGAPLGAIIRKGGLGMPVVVSVLLFIIYYIISMMGERSAREAVISPAAGMWISAFILLPLGIILTYKSVTDSEMMNTEAYTRVFKKLIAFIKKKKNAKS